MLVANKARMYSSRCNPMIPDCRSWIVVLSRRIYCTREDTVFLFINLSYLFCIILLEKLLYILYISILMHYLIFHNFYNRDSFCKNRSACRDYSRLSSQLFAIEYKRLQCNKFRIFIIRSRSGITGNPPHERLSHNFSPFIRSSNSYSQPM